MAGQLIRLLGLEGSLKTIGYQLQGLRVLSWIGSLLGVTGVVEQMRDFSYG